MAVKRPLYLPKVVKIKFDFYTKIPFNFCCDFMRELRNDSRTAVVGAG